MKTIKHLSFISLIIILITSCSMDKRLYMRGHHIEWYKTKHSLAKNISAGKSSSKVSAVRALPAEQAFADGADNSPVQTVAAGEITASADKNPVILRSDKPVLSFKKANTVEENKIVAGKQEASGEVKKANRHKSAEGSGKSQLVALLLCVLIGVLGIHRFYLGYIGIGILQLLTLGGCGIWALVDLIMIITGDLKPKNGDYDKKLD